MDLPPSGWYPDPYGTPSLLRWWDGSGWTQHTHPDVTAGAGGGGEPAATALQATAVQGAAVQATAVQPAATAVQATAVQATSVRATAGQATSVRATAGQPSAERLSRTKPPTGRPTAPQPALPAFPGAGVGPTAYQPAVTAVQSAAMGQSGGTGAMQPTAVQPGYPQPGSVSPMAGQAGGGDGTQVLFLGGDAWQVPGGPGGPGGLGGPGNPYGYAEAQRRRRKRVIIGLSAGTAVAVAAIVIIATSLSGSPSTPVADQTPAALPSSPAASVPSATPTAPASPTASPTATAAAAGSLLTDSQAGVSYSQLPAPWQGASCPPSLNTGVFPWTAGEYATAGQINGGSMTWYAEACSGLLPVQYGYNGVANLQSTAENLAQTFSNAYYGALSHSMNPGQDAPTQVSGHAAWEVTYDLSYDNASAQGATWTDEQAAVVVVDNGTNQPAVFFTSVPDTLNEANITTLVSSLQLNSAGAGQPDTATPTATPTDGSQDGGNGGNGGNGDGSGGANP
jgi:Protein of unknown function (DUF2510)